MCSNDVGKRGFRHQGELAGRSTRLDEHHRIWSTEYKPMTVGWDVQVPWMGPLLGSCTDVCRPQIPAHPTGCPAWEPDRPERASVLRWIAPQQGADRVYKSKS